MPKSRRLKVTIACACPFTAASSTISSEGSFSCGRQIKCDSTGSASAASASTNMTAWRMSRPAAAQCSARIHTASYSSIRATLASNWTCPSNAAPSSAADAPDGLRIAATTTSVSSTSRMDDFDITRDVRQLLTQRPSRCPIRPRAPCRPPRAGTSVPAAPRPNAGMFTYTFS